MSAVAVSAATLGRRVGAYLIDGAVALVILIAAAGAFAGISFATAGGFPLWLAGLLAYAVGLVWFLVYTLMQGGGGSLGMRALGLRLALLPTLAPGEEEVAGARIGFGRALGRNVVWALGTVIVVGYFSPLFDSSPWRRGWHDKAAGTVMTDVVGRGVEVVAAGADSAGDAQPAPSSPSVPTTLPASLVLPVDEDTALAGWTPAGAGRPVPTPAASSGVISFVPGVSDPELYDAPPATPPASLPVVEVGGAPDAAPLPTLLDEVPDHTRMSGHGGRPDADHALARLVWDDGTGQALYGRSVFGRNPAPESGAMVFPVRDETLSLSKTHFELAPGEDRTLWVLDRYSTNGVVILRGTARQQITPGERTRVRMGEVLEFGDRSLRIEVAP